MNNDQQKTGYLESRFKLFYISDQNCIRFPLHYHDFHKIMIFLRGNVSYVIEGKQYELLPEDILLIHAGELHRPIIHDTSVYERMVFYISPHFFEELTRKGHDLFHCFCLSRSQQSSLLRLSRDQGGEIKRVCHELTDSFLSNSYAGELYRETKFIWYAIIMVVEKKILGLEEDGNIDILDVKCDPDLVGMIIQTYGFLPGYHMNKQHWITILLDDSVSEAKTLDFLDMSYDLIDGGK